MSIQWKCVKCETVMLSKCPVQRNIHCEGTHESQYIKMNTVANVVRVKEDHHEVFLNVTVYDNSSKADIVRKALDWAGAKAEPVDFNSAYCDHIWVIADSVNHECSLGCQHPNWSDRDKILAELKENSTPTTKSLDKEFYNVIHNDLYQYANGLIKHIPGYLAYEDKQQVYYKIMDCLTHAQCNIRRDMVKLRDGINVLPMYKVRAQGRTFQCDSIPELHTYCMGLKVQGIGFNLSKLRSNYSSYERWEPSLEELNLNLYCEACSKLLENELTYLEGKAYHPKCAAKKLDWTVIKNRKIVWRAPKDFEFRPTVSNIEHDSLARSVIRRAGYLGDCILEVDPRLVRYARRYNHIVIKAQCTLELAEKILEQLNRN